MAALRFQSLDAILDRGEHDLAGNRRRVLLRDRRAPPTLAFDPGRVGDVVDDMLGEPLLSAADFGVPAKCVVVDVREYVRCRIHGVFSC